MVACDPGAVKWCQDYFGECVYDTQGVVSVILGILSTCWWLVCQSPQIYENYQRSSADSLALPFLCAWLLGDLCNLAGCLLTNQLPTQLYQAIYFVSIDTVLFSQFVWYSCIRKKKTPEPVVVAVAHGGASGPRTVDESTSLLTVHTTVGSDAYTSVNPSERVGPGMQRSDGPNVSVVALRSMLVFGLFGLASLASVALSPGVPAESRVGGRVLHAHTDRKTTLNIVGTVLAWTSAVLYLSSRLPQILLNYRRGSTDGLSLIMFFCAVMGNSFYSVSLFLNTFGWHEYRTRLPYLIGSIGTLQFDFTVFLQFHWYKGKEPKVPEIDV